MSDISIGIDPLMQLLVKLYYTIGIWQNGSSSKLRQIIRTSIFSFCAFSYPISLAGGGLINDDLGDSIFLWTLGIVVAVIEFKAFYVFFKQDNILTLLRATCTHSIPKNERLLYRVNKTLNVFKKCCIAFIILSVALTLIIMILSSPLTSDKLPFNIWFPLDYKSSHVAHWVAHCFVFINELFVIIVALLSPITWYVMLNCAIKYYIIGYRYKNVDVSVNLDNQSVLGDRDIFETEMIKCIKMQILLEENVDTIGSFFSALFFVQIGTSAFCICGSVYILAIGAHESLFYVCIGLLYYATLDIFILMYLGNEIKVASSNLAYCLFKSNWMEQEKSSKITMVIIAEVAKRHKLIMVAKLYSLTLETFNSIMRGAYSMFNVLNSM